MTAGNTTPGKSRFSFMARKRTNSEVSRPDRSRRTITCRCLFGRPNPADINRMLQDSQLNERQRALKRYNFDLWTEKPVEEPAKAKEKTPMKAESEKFKMDVEFCEEDKENFDRKRRSVSRSPRRRTPKSLKFTGMSNRQLHMTDFWRHRKHSESSSSDKEN